MKCLRFMVNTVLQIREVLHRPVSANTRVKPVSRTAGAVFDVIFVEACTPSFLLSVSTVQTIRWPIKVELTKSPGISTVWLCLTSSSISFTKCCSPEEIFFILVQQDAKRFLIASRKFCM